MNNKGTHIILGQGLAGSALAWLLHWSGYQVQIIDRGEPGSASRIAAGLITPITGRRFTRAVDFDQSRAFMEPFYRRVESSVNKTLLETAPAERYFRDSEEKAYYLKERAESYRDEVEWIGETPESIVGIRMLKAARLRVNDYLKATKDFFCDRGEYHQTYVSLASDIVLVENGVRLLNLPVEGTRLFFCQGYQAEDNPWFPGIPDAPSRGEILKVRIPSRSDKRVIHRRHWLVPARAEDQEKDNHEYLLGATYDRENLSAGMTLQGRTELEESLREITSEEAEFVEQQVAIRAGTKNRRAVLGIHPQYQQLAILNGLGSKGSLLAPLAASQLIDLLSAHSVSKAVAKKKPLSLTKMAHTIVQRATKAGDTVIDATAGNGHDTLCLAVCVGPSGHVISIDRQDSAIQTTRSRLDENGISGVQQHQADHGELLTRLAAENAKAHAIMFNLGYLPGGDKRYTTSTESTVRAITAGLRILGDGGVMTVVAYRGHPGGKEEATAVEEMAREQEVGTINVDIIPGSEDNDESPLLFVFRKPKG